MLFSSIPFLFYFLPCVFVLYFLVPMRWKNTVLLLASLFFYAWGEPKFVVFMLASIVQGYVLARLVEKYRADRGRAKLFLTLSLVFSLGLLGYCKYADFFLSGFNALTGLHIPLLRVALPIGISFYTFQILSYVIDLYWGKVHVQRNFFYLLLYVSFFPQLIAGPIVRYSTIEDEILHRKETWDDVEAGVKRFGRIDVLVNNAGHGQFTYFEESDEQQIRDVFETNLFGLMRVTRAVLPVMRRQHAGHIFNISSAAGYSGVGPSIYHTSKFAVTGFSESLAFETEQFGIRVTIVAPGLFRTDFMNFNSAYHLPARPIADYDAFRERMSGFVKYMNGREPGNPEVLGRLVVKAADSENPPLHLPVGADAIETLETHHEAQRKDVEAWREVSCATAFPPEESEVDTQAFFQ